MDKERLDYIVSRINGFDQYISASLFFLSLKDNVEFLDYIKKEGFYIKDDILASIVNFAKAYSKENNIGSVKERDNKILGIPGDSVGINKKYMGMSMWDFANMYSNSEQSSIKKR